MSNESQVAIDDDASIDLGPEPASVKIAPAPVAKKRVRKPVVKSVCPVCKKSFTGPRQAQKLGAHKYAMHTRHKVRAQAKKAIKRVIDLAPKGTELEKVSKLITDVAALSPASKKIIAAFVNS